MRAFAFLGLLSVALAAPVLESSTKDIKPTFTAHNNEISREQVLWPTEEKTTLSNDVFKADFTKTKDDKYNILWQYKGPAAGGLYSGKVLSDQGEYLAHWIGGPQAPAGGTGLKKVGEHLNFVVEHWTVF